MGSIPTGGTTKETWTRELIKNRWKETIMSKVRSKSRLDLSSKASRTNGARGISLKHEFGGRKSRWQTPMTTDWWRQHCQCESARHCTLMNWRESYNIIMATLLANTIWSSAKALTRGNRYSVSISPILSSRIFTYPKSSTMMSLSPRPDEKARRLLFVCWQKVCWRIQLRCWWY